MTLKYKPFLQCAPSAEKTVAYNENTQELFRKIRNQYTHAEKMWSQGIAPIRRIGITGSEGTGRTTLAYVLRDMLDKCVMYKTYYAAFNPGQETASTVDGVRNVFMNIEDLVWRTDSIILLDDLFCLEEYDSLILLTLLDEVSRLDGLSILICDNDVCSDWLIKKVRNLSDVWIDMDDKEHGLSREAYRSTMVRMGCPDLADTTPAQHGISTIADLTRWVQHIKRAQAMQQILEAEQTT